MEDDNYDIEEIPINSSRNAKPMNANDTSPLGRSLVLPPINPPKLEQSFCFDKSFLQNVREQFETPKNTT